MKVAEACTLVNSITKLSLVKLGIGHSSSLVVKLMLLAIEP